MYNKIEYKREIISGGVISESRLNELGAEGWDCYDHEFNVYFFKRQEVVILTPLMAEKAEDKTGGTDKKAKGK